LEDELGGDLVDDFAAVLYVAAGFVEGALGGDGGEAFVPELDGQMGAFFQRLGELADPTRLPALGAAHVDGVAEEDEADFAFADELLQEIQDRAYAGADEVWKALRCDAEGIADGQPDAALAQIEGEDTVKGNGQVISL